VGRSCDGQSRDGWFWWLTSLTQVAYLRCRSSRSRLPRVPVSGSSPRTLTALCCAVMARALCGRGRAGGHPGRDGDGATTEWLHDLPMLPWAGRPIGVANAHPEVLALVDEVCASNDEDGVAQALEALLVDFLAWFDSPAYSVYRRAVPDDTQYLGGSVSGNTR
jgi:hypothetical protein